jgi:hypothetical protein
MSKDLTNHVVLNSNGYRAYAGVVDKLSSAAEGKNNLNSRHIAEDSSPILLY